MAFRQKKSSKSKTKSTGKKKFWFRNEKFHFILGIFLLSFSAFLLISFVSFLFYGAADQSIMDAPLERVFVRLF